MRGGLILVESEISGPLGSLALNLILDTGATTSLIDGSLLKVVGYDPDASPDRAVITTGNGAVTAPRLMVNRLTAQGRHAIGLRVIAHDLPGEAKADGLLGLDFFRGLAPTIDFRAGRIALA